MSHQIKKKLNDYYKKFVSLSKSIFSLLREPPASLRDDAMQNLDHDIDFVAKDVKTLLNRVKYKSKLEQINKLAKANQSAISALEQTIKEECESLYKKYANSFSDVMEKVSELNGSVSVLSKQDFVGTLSRQREKLEEIYGVVNRLDTTLSAKNDSAGAFTNNQLAQIKDLLKKELEQDKTNSSGEFKELGDQIKSLVQRLDALPSQKDITSLTTSVRQTKALLGGGEKDKPAPLND